MVQSLLSNFAIIFLMHIIVERLELERLQRRAIWIDALVVITISFSVVSMFYLPISFAGYNFDLRFIPLLFTALNRPPKITLSILIITVLFRMIMGGDGALPGIVFGLVMPTLFTMLFRIKEYRKKKLIPILVICTIDWMISDIPAIYIIPDGWHVFQQMAVLRYLSFIVATSTLFFLVYQAKTRLQLEARLLYESTHDQLTGVWNKNTILTEIQRRVRSAHSPAFIAMVDVDYFKQVNDQFGHMTGDKVLKEIASLLKQEEEGAPYSSVARYGGEEFIYYVEVGTLEEAIQYFDGVRSRIKAQQFYSVNGERIFQLTISIGISAIESADTIDRDLEKADHFVYQAKNSGRNCIIY